MAMGRDAQQGGSGISTYTPPTSPVKNGMRQLRDGVGAVTFGGGCRRLDSCQFAQARVLYLSYTRLSQETRSGSTSEPEIPPI